MIPRSLKSNNLSGPIPPSFGTGNYFTSSNGDLLLDLQNNSLSVISASLTKAVKYRPNLFVWVHGNHEICATNDTLIRRLCKMHHDISLSESKVGDDNYSPSCDPMTCSSGEEPIPAIFYSQGLCRCALPIIVGYRLKSPSFAFFMPFIKGYEEWIARGILISPYQVHLDSFTKEAGPRFSTVLKIFPPVNGSRIFLEAELLRIFSIFSAWKMPPNEFYGPQELLFFNYTLYQGDLHALTSYKQRWKVILVITLSSSFAIIAAVAIMVVFFSRHRAFNRNTRGFKRAAKSLESRERLMNISGVKEFSLKELAMATRNFHEGTQVGQGGYGRVYKGVLSNGTIVAIKRAKEDSRQGYNEFYTEIELLSRLHHRNLVSLLGYCIDQDEQMLVYEYMPNGTLKDRLSTAENGEDTLDFASRLRVAMGAAKGIRYLHVEATPPIIHRDIKASNILLDKDNNPRVADFGLSRLAPSQVDQEGNASCGHVSTVVKGTPGYLDPEYFLTHKLTDKSDVYSFGVVLLELITGMQPIFDGKNIVREVKHAYDTSNLLSVVDVKMGAYPMEALGPLVRLALACCKDDTIERPSMNEVVQDLEIIWHIVPWSKSKSTSKTNLILLTRPSHKVDSLSSKKGSPPDLSHKSSETIDYDASDVFDLNLQANVIPR